MKNKELQSYSHIFMGVIEHLFALGIVSILSFLAVKFVLPFLDNSLDTVYWGILVISGSVIWYILFILINYLISDRMNMKRSYLFHIISFLLILFLNISISAATIFFIKQNNEKYDKAETSISNTLSRCVDDFNKSYSPAKFRCSVVYYDKETKMLRMPKNGFLGQDSNTKIQDIKYDVSDKKEDETEAEYLKRLGVFGCVFKNHKIVNDSNIQNLKKDKNYIYREVEISTGFEPDQSILCVPIDEQKETVGVACVSSTTNIVFTKKEDSMKDFANRLSEAVSILSNKGKTN